MFKSDEILNAGPPLVFFSQERVLISLKWRNFGPRLLDLEIFAKIRHICNFYEIATKRQKFGVLESCHFISYSIPYDMAGTKVVWKIKKSGQNFDDDRNAIFDS